MRKYTVETPDTAEYPLFQVVDGVLMISDDAETIVDEVLEARGTTMPLEFLYINASDAFRVQRENAKKQKDELKKSEYEGIDEERLFWHAHHELYEKQLGEKRYLRFMEMSDAEQGDKFYEIYEDRLRSAGKSPTASALKTLDAYVEWFCTGASMSTIQQQRELNPGQLKNMINRMPGYVVEGWHSHFPGSRIDLAKLAIKGNVITYDFASAEGPSKRYTKSADVFHLTDVPLKSYS